MIMIILVKGKR